MFYFSTRSFGVSSGSLAQDVSPRQMVSKADGKSHLPRRTTARVGIGNNCISVFIRPSINLLHFLELPYYLLLRTEHSKKVYL